VTGSLDCRLKLCVSRTSANNFSFNTHEYLIRWKEETGELLQTVQGHKGDVLAMQPITGRLFSASVDRTIRMWKIQPDRTVKDSEAVSMVGHSAAVELLAIGGPRCGILVSASSDKTVRVRRNAVFRAFDDI
jgi:WD40 repeat protein